MKEFEGVTFNGEMPICQYEVLDPETQLPATVVSVGDALLHRWSCSSNAPSECCRYHRIISLSSIIFAIIWRFPFEISLTIFPVWQHTQRQSECQEKLFRVV